MTIMMSCDHHDESGSVPDNRSRARMLEQLRAAEALAEALGDLFTAARVFRGATVTVPMAATVPLTQAWLAWNKVAPRDDDWAPPHIPPSEIRIPPDAPVPVDEA